MDAEVWNAIGKIIYTVYRHDEQGVSPESDLYQASYFHPKTLNVDGKICTVGTANMDIRSFSLNYEGNAVIYDQAHSQELEQAFLKDLDDCQEWKLEECTHAWLGQCRFWPMIEIIGYRKKGVQNALINLFVTGFLI